LHINTTAHDGGVVEILSGLIPLLKDLGIQAYWQFIPGAEDFFEITKSFHNALQGQNIYLSQKAKHIYKYQNALFA
jgi:trehalose synthase